MLHQFQFAVEFFAWLDGLDRQLARWVAQLGCPHCGGPLHQGNYERKPRGALVEAPGIARSRKGTVGCSFPGSTDERRKGAAICSSEVEAPGIALS